MKILLLGSNERAAFSLAKSYKGAGYHVDVFNDCYHPLKHSKFVDYFFIAKNSSTKRTEGFVVELLAHLSANQYDFLIPVNDTALTICKEFDHRISEKTTIATVNDDVAHQYCRDKSALLKLCATLGIAVPKSELIHSIEDLNKIKNIIYPCIIKPVSSKVYRDGKIFSYGVKKIKTEAKLVDFVRENIHTLPMMIQENLSGGFGLGFNFIAKDGEILNAYIHQRINEAWGGGQSTYRKTLPLHSYDLDKIAEKIVREIKWNGIGMLEFLILDGTPYIMELNGRAWGSIELGVFSKCNLPLDLIKLHSNHTSITKTNFEQTYFAKNLFNEFLWILKTKSPVKFMKWLVSLKSGFKKNHIIEDSVLRDPFFRLAFIYHTFSEKTGKFLKRIKRKLSFKRIPVIDKKLVNVDKKIGFICKGNINRSAFAEFYCKKYYPQYNVGSYGVIFKENRLSPMNAIQSSAKFGVDLNVHRSKYLTQEDINEIDIFLIMDEINYWDLLEMNTPDKKIFKLHEKDIPDPYGFDCDYFEKVYLMISESINKTF